MDVETVTRLKEEIDALKLTQEKLFEAGWQEGRKKKAGLVITLLLILCGIAGVIEVLYRGIGWLSATFIVVGAIAFYRGMESDKATKCCREQYEKNRSKLSVLEEKYQELTFIPKTPEQIEGEWKDLMRELDGQTRHTP